MSADYPLPLKSIGKNIADNFMKIIITITLEWLFYSFGYSLASKFKIDDVRHLENAPDISGTRATSIEIQGNIHGNWHSCSPICLRRGV